MPRFIALFALILGLSGVAVAGTSARWRCSTAPDAQLRKQRVVQDLLPRVVFSGETQPERVETRMQQHLTPAFSVAVLRKGRLDWSAAWGRLAHGGARAGCDSLFQAGSLAKPVTLMATFRMKEAGLLDLDANIDTYLTSLQLPPGQQRADNPVTLRHLLAHTAGITPGGYMGYADGQALPTDLQTVRGEAPANSRRVEVMQAPGTALAYSGGGYTLIEIALQDQLGRPFEAIMQEWLLAPVGMKQAEFTLPLPNARHARTARGHTGDGLAVAGGWHHHPEQAAAGLWATASDLAAFLIEIHRGHLGESKVFSRASIEELLARPFEEHAYGFRLIGAEDEVFITHYGGTVGYRAGMTLNVRTGDGAVYLGNADHAGTLGAEFLAAVSRTYGWPVFEGITVERVPRSGEVLQSLAGPYDFTDGPTLTVLYEDAALVLVFPNGDRYVMAPIRGAPLEFIHPQTGVRASFAGEGDGMSIELYGETGRRRVVSQ